jgi:hypothetical protein
MISILIAESWKSYLLMSNFQVNGILDIVLQLIHQLKYIPQSYITLNEDFFISILVANKEA